MIHVNLALQTYKIVPPNGCFFTNIELPQFATTPLCQQFQVDIRSPIYYPIRKGDPSNPSIKRILRFGWFWPFDSYLNDFYHTKTALRMLKNLIKCYLDMDVSHISSTLYRLQEMSNHSLRFVVTAGCRIEIAPLPPRHNSLNILTKLTTASIHRELKNVKNVHWKNTCLNNNHQHIKNVDVKIKLSIHQKCYRKCVETSTVNVNIRLC